MTAAAWIVVAASTAVAGDCWSTRENLCCKTMWIGCTYKQGEQTIRWYCPQQTDKPAGFKVKTVVPVAKGIKGKTEIADPAVVGECKRATSKCGALPGECIATGIEAVVCSSVNVQGDNCVGE